MDSADKAVPTSNKMSSDEEYDDYVYEDDDDGFGQDAEDQGEFCSFFSSDYLGISLMCQNQSRSLTSTMY